MIFSDEFTQIFERKKVDIFKDRKRTLTYFKYDFIHSENPVN